jgi:hypothetical protein
MRFLKFAVILGIFAFGVYYISASYMEDSKTYTLQKEVNYPLEKIFPQFNNLQNYKHWNSFFKDQKNLKYSFFTPYEGQNSTLSWSNEKGKNEGDISIKFSEPNKAIRYFWFRPNEKFPTVVDVKFKKISPEKTLLSYVVKTPKIPVLMRPFHVVSESFYTENITSSLVNLSNLLSNKVDKENQLARLKFDSVMVEKQSSAILLGINVSASNKKDALVKNIVLNYNKVKNFLLTDLQKEPDEFGLPVLITDPNDLKSKDVFYFIGFPISKKVNVSDNNFIYRYLSEQNQLIIYYKGDYFGRLRALQKLNSEAKKQELRTGQLHETFLENPSETGEETLKLALEIL